jgi:hypothetical protein
VETLLGWWADARQRAFLGEYGPASVALDPADYLTEIALGTRIAAEVTSGRWVAVARLLQLGAVSHWDEIGTALGVTGEEAVAGFTSWITSQAALYRRTGIGLTDADAHAHVRLADAVPGDHIPRHNCPRPARRRGAR